MKHILKYTAIILVAVVVLVILLKLKNCGGGKTQRTTVSVPADTNFAAVVKETYQPPSLPLSKKSSRVKLPAGVKEKDVKKVVTIEVRDVPRDPPKKIEIIETNEGETFVHKDPSIVSVRVTEFQPPIVRLQLKSAAGVSVGKSGRGLRFSPAGIFAPVEWVGWIHAPILFTDLDGLGVGLQVRLYHNICVGTVRIWRYDHGNQAKLFLVYII